MEDKNKTTKITELEGEEALLARLGVVYDNDEELTEKGESSASNYSSLFSVEEREKVKKLTELENEATKLKNEVKQELNDIEARQKKGEITTREEVNKIREKNNLLQVLWAKIDNLNKELGIYESDSDIYSDEDFSDSEESEDELSASTSKGKEIIQAKISQELAAARETFANFTIKKNTWDKVEYRIKTKVNKMEYRWDGGDKFVNTLGAVPVFGTLFGPVSSCDISDKAQNSIKSQVKEKLPNVVWDLIKETTTDLETQKEKVLEKMDQLIEARHKEVFAAKDAIAKMESVIEGLKLKNKHQKEKSDREKGESEESIRNLQEGIKELRNRLAEYEKSKEEFKGC